MNNCNPHLEDCITKLILDTKKKIIHPEDFSVDVLNKLIHNQLLRETSSIDQSETDSGTDSLLALLNEIYVEASKILSKNNSELTQIVKREELLHEFDKNIELIKYKFEAVETLSNELNDEKGDFLVKGFDRIFELVEEKQKVEEQKSKFYSELEESNF